MCILGSNKEAKKRYAELVPHINTIVAESDCNRKERHLKKRKLFEDGMFLEFDLLIYSWKTCFITLKPLHLYIYT